MSLHYVHSQQFHFCMLQKMKIDDYFLSGVFSYGYYYMDIVICSVNYFIFYQSLLFPIMSPDLSIIFKVITRNFRFTSIPDPRSTSQVNSNRANRKIVFKMTFKFSLLQRSKEDISYNHKDINIIWDILLKKFNNYLQEKTEYLHQIIALNSKEKAHQVIIFFFNINRLTLTIKVSIRLSEIVFNKRNRMSNFST